VKSLADSVALVTGGGIGLGRALAVEAAARGAKVALATPFDASETVEEIRRAGGVACWVDVDIADYDSVSAGVSRIVDEWGHVDVLVNNAAGSPASGPLQSTDPETVRRQFEINVLGTYHCLRACYESLRDAAASGRGAHVLNIGSEHSLGVPPHAPPMSTYTVSKYTSLAFTDVVRRDFADAGIGVTMVAPSWVLTETVRDAVARIDAVASMVEGRAQTPEHVATAAWDAVLADTYLLLTNAASRDFAERHARGLLEAITSAGA
jgi:NAD(P)-dependent dehydrogenase (short-subunit alcohol dehydrogenase family)